MAANISAPLEVLFSIFEDGEDDEWLYQCNKTRLNRRRRMDEYRPLHTLAGVAVSESWSHFHLKQTTALSTTTDRETHHRTEGYIENVVPSYSLWDFVSHFRLDRGTIEILMGELHRSGIKETPFCGGNQPISLQKMTLVCLWYLGNQESMRGIADRFDIAKSTVHQVVAKVTHHLAHFIAPLYIHWPSQQEMYEIAVEFKSRANFPGVIGAIDASHIPIQPPCDHQVEYNNRKMTHSVILQAVCDHSKKFIHCFAGFPGSAHDARVFNNSQLYRQVMQDKSALFPNDSYHLVGDTAYPLHSWLLTPFKDYGTLSPQQVRYNTNLSQTRVVVECAFGLLKGRFRRLKSILSKIESIPNIIIACCVLHNLCLVNNDNEDIFDTETMLTTSSESTACALESTQGTVKRNYVVSML